jgi:hypothetical protein
MRTEAPGVIAKKVGGFYYTFHRKGQFREEDDLADSLHHGRKVSNKSDAETFRKWQNKVNNAHAIIVTYGTNHVVYIRGDEKFKTQAEANAHAKKRATEGAAWRKKMGFVG